MVWVKICGITDSKEALGIAAMGADALGFILSTESRRRVGTEQAEKIIETVRREYKKKAPRMVGVFVNENLNYVGEAINKLGLDMAQFCGDEDYVYMEKVSKLGKIEIIKTIACKAGMDIESLIRTYGQAADYFLLDTYSSKSQGGTGRVFDWGMAKGLKELERIILAGGLGPDNVYHALCEVKPFGVDASSKMEAGDGKKNIKRAGKFIEIIKGFSNEEEK